ncbi:MAG: cytochrome c maturation protein CcmE [Candidatus Binatia bacterium]
MKKEYKFIIGIGLIVATVAFLIFTAVDQTRMYMITVGEYLSSGKAFAGSRVRVAGRVAPGSVRWNQSKTDLYFAIDDIEADGTIEVHYNGLLPDMFAEGRDVVVEGPFVPGGTFEASTILTSCPSKYQAEQAQPDPQ